MSIFPAYSSVVSKPEEEAVPSTSATAVKWLENSSFALLEHQIRDVQSQKDSPIEVNSDKDESECDNKYHEDDSLDFDEQQSHRKSKIQKKPKLKTLEFQGDEEFYIDKQPSKSYKSIQELTKPACPRYRKTIKRPIGDNWFLRRKSKQLTKRYYRHKHDRENVVSKVILSENEFTEQVGNLNRKTMESPKVLEPWLELIDLQDRNPYKLSKLLLAERKLDIIARSLNYNPRNDKLYHRYIDIISSTYPSFEVNKMLDRLLSKDPYSYTLWTAQILATQCSMARCVVPEVLKIYERCMQKMFHASQRSDGEGFDDDVILKLFNNCALFLRQAGLNEQFFALIKLALELNVSTDKIERLQTLDSDQATLIEYEELILQSGLPMNEIWLRIEKLRQSYNFLPIPLNAKCSDPQRIVFNEDVCHYIYPLKSRENSFYLILLVLRLLKFPFVHCDMLAEKFCARVQDIGDSDAIEDALTICLRNTFSNGVEQQSFLSSLYELVKDMAVSPTFISNHIGHELYIRCITQLLLNCASAYAGIDERKRVALLLLWCRFERLLLILQKCAKKLTAEYVRAGRSRFKALLKQLSNIDVVNFYTEFAIYEYEAQGLDNTADNMQTVRNIFENVITKNVDNETGSRNVCFACLTYAQILISSECRQEAFRVLYSYIMQTDIKPKAGCISNPKKLGAMQAISKKLDDVIAIERNVEIMVLEQYLLPDSTVSLLYMRILLQYLMGQKLDAMAYLEKLLGIFKKTSERSCFLREQIYEIYLALLGQKSGQDCSISNSLICAKVSDALVEFPRNLFFMQRCGTLNTLPWYKVRTTLLGRNVSAMSVVFLVTSARYRFMDRYVITSETGEAAEQISALDLRHNETIVRNRILSIFKSLLLAADSNDGQHNMFVALQRNSLLWRFYLRSLSDQCIPFDTSKKCLLQALDQCPWSKALYMDGAKYVPQELSHLQDLIIEKHMRIYALPDELEILREK